MRQTITCLYDNGIGLSVKLGGPIYICHQLHLEVIAPTETWLPPDVMDGEVREEGMTVFRYNRVHKGRGDVTLHIGSNHIVSNKQQ